MRRLQRDTSKFLVPAKDGGNKNHRVGQRRIKSSSGKYYPAHGLRCSRCGEEGGFPSEFEQMKCET